MPCKDREKRLQSCKRWREKNKNKLRREYQADKNGIRTRRMLQRKKNKLAYFQEKLKLECIRCGENHIACLEFHHIDKSEKEFNISELHRYTLKKIKEEMQKCIVLCSNCHKKEHWDNNKIKNLLNDIKRLEDLNRSKRNSKIKKCRDCGKTEDEVEFVKRRLFCINCYKQYQRNKMRNRRKTKKEEIYV